jgi:hypothetical protein
MILVVQSNKHWVFDTPQEAIDFLDKQKIHPDLAKIFIGDITEIPFPKLLSENDESDLDIERIKQEAILLQVAINNIFNEIENYGGIITYNVYPYGSLEYNNLLNGLGCQPLIKYEINFRASLPSQFNRLTHKFPDVNSKKLRRLIGKMDLQGWKLYKVVSASTVHSTGGYVWQCYNVFLTQPRQNLTKKGEK